MVYVKVKVWFQNRRTKYKRAKVDEETDELPEQSSDSEKRREQTETTNDDDDDDDVENGVSMSSSDVVDALDCSSSAIVLSVSRSHTPPSAAVCRHIVAGKQEPPAGCHGESFRSTLLLSRHTVSGSQDSGRKHGCNSASTTARRNKTSHHVNRWRAETNQL